MVDKMMKIFCLFGWHQWKRGYGYIAFPQGRDFCKICYQFKIKK